MAEDPHLLTEIPPRERQRILAALTEAPFFCRSDDRAAFQLLRRHQEAFTAFFAHFFGLTMQVRPQLARLYRSMGSSFGNNLNNRAEEILGQSLDFTKAYERRVFRDCPRTFLGNCVILADGPKIHRPVSAYSSHFEILPEFAQAGHAERFNLLCWMMVEEELYSEAALILSEPVAGGKSGANRAMSDVTSFRRFITGLAAHVARKAAL